MTRSKQPDSMLRIRTAPDDLEILQALVNTSDRLQGTEKLSSPRLLGGWLDKWRLRARGAEFAQADVGRVTEVREDLRALMRANNGGPAADRAAARLDRAAEEATIRVRIYGDGIHLEPTAGGLDEAFGHLFRILAAAWIDGRWRRLKACANPRCQAAFYDAPGNGKWCSMRRCGNVLKARTYRRRKAARRSRSA